jgi:hypothetical protein
MELLTPIIADLYLINGLDSLNPKAFIKQLSAKIVVFGQLQ